MMHHGRASTTFAPTSRTLVVVVFASTLLLVVLPEIDANEVCVCVLHIRIETPLLASKVDLKIPNLKEHH